MTQTCDFASEFTPAYVEYYLAPGAETLREESSARFGRPDAIRVGLGSIVNLVAHGDLVDTLLEYEIVGDAAPSLAGMRVADIVDTVTIHYTMSSPGAVDAVDALYDRWMAEPDASVRSLWMTEEVGARAAESGFGLSAALRAIAPTMNWWTERGLDPARGHIFLWGTDIGCPDVGPECLSVDDAMPTFADFAGDRPLVAISDVDVESDGELEAFAWHAGDDRRIIVAWPASDAPVSVSNVQIDVTDWAGPISANAYRVGDEGLPELAVTRDGNSFALTTTIEEREVLLFLLAQE